MSLVRIGRPGVRAWIAWSGGKNAAYALERARERGEDRIEGLFAFVDGQGALLGSGVPAPLLQEQASSVGLPLRTVEAPARDTDGLDAAIPALRGLAEEGVKRLVFGDPAEGSTLPDHRRLAVAAGLEPRFVLADEPASTLAEAMVHAGLRAVLSAVDASRAPRAWVGRVFSSALLEEWPEGVHPTGGRGEFHTFACGGSVFSRPLSPRWEALEHPGTWALARLVPGPRRGYGA